jgi:hypothetical protein
MTGREKPKRKALHRGLDDIVNRDASLTSKLLGRVKSPAREPLEVSPAPGEDAPPSPVGAGGARAAEGQAPDAVTSRPRPQAEQSSVHRLEPQRPEPSAQPREAAGGREVASVTPLRAAVPFDEFVSRWGFILRSGGRAGKMRICEVLYNNTYAVGRETFFTSYEKLAKLAGLEKKQCAINVKQLETLGFIERLNIYNTATKQGTEFKLHLEKLPPNARSAPRHHHYDEDLGSEG